MIHPEEDGHAPSSSASRVSVASCRARLSSCREEDLGSLLAELETDPRSGVRYLAAAWRRRVAATAAEDARLDRLTAHQRSLHEIGMSVVAGVDEVGRGALAGPLSVGAVVLAVSARIPGLDDSKRLAPARRRLIAAEVRRLADVFCVVHVQADEIDRIGIAQAVRTGMVRALAGLGIPVDHSLVDGNDARLGVPATPVVKGDSLCACIAAASVVAKVERDALMVSLAGDFPGYGLDINKGYGTAEHIAALSRLGPSLIHRRSFSPCSQRTLFE